MEPKWIWCGDDDTAGLNVWGWARRKFTGAAGEPATLEISADLRYMAWLNGERLGFGPPKFHAQTPTIDVYDISSQLHTGENVLVVCVYSLGPAPITSCMPQRGALWVRVRHSGGEIISDKQWKMRRDPAYMQETATRHDLQPPCECYDARLALGRPQAVNYDDSAWPAATELETPADFQMERRDIPFMTAECFAPDRVIAAGIAAFETAYAQVPLPALAKAIATASEEPDRENCIAGMEMDARGLNETQSVYALFDFGRIWTGYPVLRIQGTPGTIVDISYSEDLLRYRIRPNKIPAYLDRIILGDEEVEHRITWPKCARYLQINVHGGKAKIASLTLERSTYPVTRKGFFASDNPVMDQAWEISAHTVQLCMEDSYMDTPWRERGSWLGDDLIKMRAAYATFGDYALARRFLLHHLRGQFPSGMMEGKYPANIPTEISTWTIRFPLSVLEYCAESGDWDFANQTGEVLTKLAAWLETLRQPNGLYEAPPVVLTAWINQYNFIDWAPIDMHGANTAWNAFAYDGLRGIGILATKIGNTALAAHAQLRATQVKEVFQRVFWDERRGIFVNGFHEGKQLPRWGCHENYLALLFDLATPEQEVSILRRLSEENLNAFFVVNEDDYDLIIPESGKIPTVAMALSQYRWPDDKMVPLGTAYFADYMLRALFRMGRIEEAQAFIEERWGEYSRQGGTTVWETWDMNQSLSHGFSCAPVVLASRYFLGLHRADELTGEYVLLPVAGKLQEARGRVMTRFGPVQIEWSKKPAWELRIDLPAGFRVKVGLPVTENSRMEVDGLPAENPEKITHCRQPYQCVELTGGKHRLLLS